MRDLRARSFDTVRIGTRIRTRSRVKFAGCLAVALVASAWSIDKISLFPPGLEPRSLELATAATHVIVDTPSSIMIDLRQDTYGLQDLTNRAVVLGNVIASTSVEAAIAQEANVPLELLRIQAPLTPLQPSAPVGSQTQRQISDIVKSNDQYRIEMKVNPTVPMLDIYAQAPTAANAAALANAAVDQLKSYVTRLATTQGTPAKDQIRVEQLGRATGAVINPGVKYEVAVLVFVLSFLGCWATVTFVTRTRTQWRAASLSERAHA